jgi:hypothetical protein
MTLPTSDVPNAAQSLKVCFSTVVRAAPLENGGEVVLLDWQDKTVEAKRPIYPTRPEIEDPNPRGNARGGRGIEVTDGGVIVASYHTLRVYDRELRHLRDVSHPLMAGLHEIRSDDNGQIAVSSTSIDAVLVMDLASGRAVRQYWPREMPGLQRDLDLTPLQIDKKVDNRTRFLATKHARDPSHLHLNSADTWRGEMYALFNAFGVIANLDRDEILIQDEALRHGHSLLIKDNGTALVNNTFGRAVCIYDLHTRTLKRTISLTKFGLVRHLILKHQLSYLARGILKRLLFPQLSAPRPVFVRGLDRVGDLLFVGISPAAILCIDWRSGELVDFYRYSEDVAVCIHGLKVLTE